MPTLIITTVIIVLVIYFLYQSINKRVTKQFAFKKAFIDMDLVNLPESHTVSGLISRSNISTPESITQKYERMCILDPVKYEGDASIPETIKKYRDIISGKVLDQKGYNVPSETILGKHNPDYDTYIANQAKAMKRAGSLNATLVFKEENNRNVRIKNEDQVRSEFVAHLVNNNIPITVIGRAISDEKIGTFKSEDWKKFCGSIKEYLQMSTPEVVAEFVSSFNEKAILFNSRKFEVFAIFWNHKVPLKTIIEIIFGNVTVDQAVKMLSLVQDYGYEWNDASEEILSEEFQETRAVGLRKGYGFNT